jgi:serine protease Do
MFDPRGRVLLAVSAMVMAAMACNLISGPTSDGEGGATPAPSSGGGSSAEAVDSLDGVKSAAIQIEAQGSFVPPDIGSPVEFAGRGSGFIIDPSGIAVTNNHVVTGAALLKVWVGGESEPRNAKILGVSECSDLAVIDIDGDGYPYLEWYQDPIDVGLEVYAAGFPLGDPEYTLTKGIVSKARAGGETNWASVDGVLQHDATINPGNSGGPLVTAEGKVVGVNYASLASANQYFAITPDVAQSVIANLRKGEDVNSIGVNGTAVSNDDGSLTGLWVLSVASGSPADAAGLQGGDLITNMEGLTLATDGTMAEYCDILRTHQPSDALSVDVLRFATGELLAGELNGRALETSSTFGNQLGGEVRSGADTSGASYSGYTTVTDDYGAIQMDIPNEWSDVDGSAWVDSGDVIGSSIWASADLNTFVNSWDQPGVIFDVSNDLAKLGGYVQLLDYERQSYVDACELDNRYDYDDGYYRGKYDLFKNCGGAGGPWYLILSAVPSDNSQAFLMLVEVQIQSDRDLEALDHILNTFDVVGTLP